MDASQICFHWAIRGTPDWFISLSLISWVSIHAVINDKILFFMVESYSIVCMLVYTPHFLCPFICQQTLRLFLGYCEWCCCEPVVLMYHCTQHTSKSSLPLFTQQLPEHWRGWMYFFIHTTPCTLARNLPRAMIQGKIKLKQLTTFTT